LAQGFDQPRTVSLQPTFQKLVGLLLKGQGWNEKLQSALLCPSLAEFGQ
jgi:hypothetical protein